MLKKHKNKIVEYLNDLEFNTSIEIEEGEDENEFLAVGPNITLNFTDTPFYYKIHSSLRHFDLFIAEYISFAPQYPRKFFPEEHETIIEACLLNLEEWNQKHLQEYLEEEKRPDLLKIYAANKNSISSINFESNEKFSEEESKLLKTGLKEIKLLIREQFEFTNAQINLIDNRIDYLEESSTRIGKTDFKGILISTILSIITSLALTPENAERLLRLFSKIIDNIPQISW